MKLFKNKLGAAAIEFSIILPVLLLMSLGLVDAARFIYLQTSLDYQVQYIARCSAINCPQGPPQAMPGIEGALYLVLPIKDTPDCKEGITILGTLPVVPLTPFFSKATLKSTYCFFD